jgi:hypothetical protein
MHTSFPRLFIETANIFSKPALFQPQVLPISQQITGSCHEDNFYSIYHVTIINQLNDHNLTKCYIKLLIDVL